MRSARQVTAATTALLLLTLALLPGGAAAQQSDTVKIDPGTHAAIQIDFRQGPTQDVSYDVQVTQGPNVDVMVMDNANYQSYRDGDGFSYIADWSDLDTGNTDLTFTVKQHGTWWLVLDHTSEPDDGTRPATLGAESVTARYTLDTKVNVEEEARDRLDRLPFPGPALLAATLAGLALAVRPRRSWPAGAG